MGGGESQESQEYKLYKMRLNSLIRPVDYSKCYVYFPLHLQPELSTSAIGGIYCDQMLAIEKLSEMIPENWVIYIKENPKQTEAMRDKFFFERIKLLDNISIVPLEEQSQKLIINSQFVATITGTAGYEALCNGIPTLIFGNPWYKHFEGVFQYSENFNINMILHYKINIKRLENDLNVLLQRMPNSVIDSDYILGIKDYNETVSMNELRHLLAYLITNDD